MIQHIDRCLRMGIPLPGEVADQPLLLGVDVDDGITFLQIPGFDLGDVLKLCIPIGMCAYGLPLSYLALS